MPLSFDDVREMALALPGIEEGTSYGTPALKVGKRLLARLKEDGETLVLRLGFDEREMLMEAEPQTFFITDHYRAYPSVLVRLAHVHPPTLRRLIEQAWREAAPKRLVRDFERRGAD
ncbi:MAG: MmcQ/YjbR family DNA-binding protein [Hyphomicrobiales bacterium]